MIYGTLLNTDRTLKEFQRRLAELKHERRLSLAAMAKACGIPKSTLDGYFKGVSPTLENIIKLSDGLGIPLNLLVAELDHGASAGCEPREALANAVHKSAYDELRTLFQTAASQPDLEMLAVENGKLGGREPDELAWQIALYITDNFKGIRSVANDLKKTEIET